MPKQSNPMPPSGGEREYDVADITGTQRQGSQDRSSTRPADQSVTTSAPVPAPTVAGTLGTGSDRAASPTNTEPVTDTPGAGLDLERGSYNPEVQEGGEVPAEYQGVNPEEYHNPLTIGGQLVQDAPITAVPNVPPGEVPLPGKEEFNALQSDGKSRNPYPVPVEAGSNHVAYAAGEVPDQEDQSASQDRSARDR
jgi:hypothetical protein